MRIAHILSLGIALVICACSDSSEFDNPVNGPEDIAGNWYFEENFGDLFIRRYETSYSLNGTYEIYLKLYDRSTKDFLGYLYWEEGEYSIDNGELLAINKNGFGSDGITPITDLADLTPMATGPERSVTLKLSDNRKMLKVFWPPCGFADSCLAGPRRYNIYTKSA